MIRRRTTFGLVLGLLALFSVGRVPAELTMALGLVAITVAFIGLVTS